MASVEINLRNLETILLKLQENKPGALQAAGLVILAAAQTAIKNSGPGWKPFKKLPKRPHQLLWDSGTLIQSFSTSGPENTTEVDGNTITVGTNVRYAVYQQEGTSRGLPARPFLLINNEVRDKAAKAYANALVRGIAA